MRIWGAIAAASMMLAAGVPADAKALPAVVEAMLREASAAPDTLAAVAKVAKATNPESVDEIDALLLAFKTKSDTAREDRLASAGLFDSWSGIASLGFSSTSGNTRDIGFILGLDLAKDGITFRHKVKADVDHQSSFGVLSRSRYLASYELDYKFDGDLFAYGLAAWDRDTFAGFNHRFSESAGLGYSLLKSASVTLDLLGGPALRQSRLIDHSMEITTTARAEADFAWKIFDRLTFSENASIYFGDGLSSSTALTGTLTSNISARASFDVHHEDHVVAGIKATDTVTHLTITYGF